MANDTLNGALSLFDRFQQYLSLRADAQALVRLCAIECRRNLALLNALRLDEGEQTDPDYLQVARLLETAALESLFAVGPKQSKARELLSQRVGLPAAPLLPASQLAPAVLPAAEPATEAVPASQPAPGPAALGGLAPPSTGGALARAAGVMGVRDAREHSPRESTAEDADLPAELLLRIYVRVTAMQKLAGLEPEGRGLRSIRWRTRLKNLASDLRQAVRRLDLALTQKP